MDESTDGMLKVVIPKLDSLTDSTASTSSKVAELETALASLQPKVENQEVDIQIAHNDIKQLEKEMDLMDMEVDELKKHKYSEKDMELVCKCVIRPFKQRIKSMETQLEALTSSTSTSSLFPSLQVQVAALQASVQPLINDAKKGEEKKKEEEKKRKEEERRQKEERRTKHGEEKGTKRKGDTPSTEQSPKRSKEDTAAGSVSETETVAVTTAAAAILAETEADSSKKAEKEKEKCQK